MSSNESNKSKRKKVRKSKFLATNTEEKVVYKAEDIEQIDGDKTETAKNLDVRSCSTAESSIDDGNPQTNAKRVAIAVTDPESSNKLESNSGSCDAKSSKDDKPAEIKTYSQATTSKGSSADDSKMDDQRQSSSTETDKKSKVKSGKAPALQTEQLKNDIQSWLKTGKPSGKEDSKDQQSTRGRPWSNMRGSDLGQEKNYKMVQSSTKGNIARPHSSERSLDPSFHSAHFHLSGRRENFHFFFKRQCPFSQHYMSEFEVDGVKYNCCEQFMMQQKALTFNDKESAAKIMATDEPNVQKRFGRQVKNFDGEVWNKISMEVVKKGNLAKFSQNPRLKDSLLKTGNKVLVEASPYDRVWGIGLAQDHADAPFPEHWLGENRLGRVLMEVREELSKETTNK